MSNGWETYQPLFGEFRNLDELVADYLELRQKYAHFERNFNDMYANLYQHAHQHLLEGGDSIFKAPGSSPAARVYHDSNQSIPNDTWTALNFNQEHFDTANMHNNITNNTRLTCTVAGVYHLSAIMHFASNTSFQRGIRFVMNGTDNNATKTGLADQSYPTYRDIDTDWRFKLNEYVEVQVYQNSGGALDSIADVGASSLWPTFSMVWV